MNPRGPLAFDKNLSQLPSDKRERHEALVDFFGQFLFWLRNSSLQASRKFIESEEWREKLGTYVAAIRKGLRGCRQSNVRLPCCSSRKR
jgi:hypothetical protein